MKKLIKFASLASLTGLLSFNMAQAAGICDRSPEIQKAILVSLGVNRPCAQITENDLLLVEDITILYEDYSQYGYNKQGGFKNPTKLGNLKDQDLAGLFNLKVLDIEFSNITEVKRSQFKDLKNLQKLDISHNLIRSFPEDVFWDLKNVTEFEFDTNEFFSAKTLPEKIFWGMPKLMSADMDECNLEFLPEKLFAKNPNLVGVDLRKNNIQQLPVGIFSGLKNLQRVYLHKNPIKKTQFLNVNNKAIVYGRGWTVF